MSRRKYVHTAETDAVVTEAYRCYVDYGDRHAIRKAAARLGWPKFKVNRRAADLGLSRPKEKPWSELELAVLRENYYYDPGVIWRKLREAGYAPRSRTAIVLKRKRLGLTSRNGHEGWTVNHLAELLNIDAHGVMDWVRCGLLSAERRFTLRKSCQGGDGWWVKQEWFRDFALSYPELLDFRKLDGVWLIEVLRKGMAATGREEEHF